MKTKKNKIKKKILNGGSCYERMKFVDSLSLYYHPYPRDKLNEVLITCLLYTSPSPRD